MTAALVLGVSLLGFSATSSAVEYFKTTEDGKLLMLNQGQNVELYVKVKAYEMAMNKCYGSGVFEKGFRAHRKQCNKIARKMYKDLVKFLQETK
jgi:hypothetical protein